MRARAVPPILVLAGLAAAADGVPARADGPGADWPFGGAVGHGGRDLYNLGILGAKARDATRAEVTFEGAGRREVRMDADPGPADDGPERLRVEILYEGGPAAKAGLKVGDVLAGVQGKKFKDGSLAPLAKALVDAESGKTKGVVKLTVERDGATIAVDVAVPVAGKDAEKPTTGKFRDQLVAAAADWLAKRQDASGGYPSTLSGTNGGVVQTSMAGLVWLATGSDAKSGAHAENVRKAAEFVAVNLAADAGDAFGERGGPNWSQVNWGLVHAGIFLGELHARCPEAGVGETLVKCAEQIAANQETSGGWAHGPGGKNALGYVELNIVTGLALNALGLAQRAGYVPPQDVLKRAEEYLVASSGGDGGVGYSTSPGQVGQGNIGRTAASWLGLVALGQRNAPFAKKTESWVRGHAGEVFGGHASLMQHFLLAGVAAHAQGGEALARYWDVCERDLVLARAPDGSFQPRPFHESIAMGSNSDVSFGDVWTTAAWATVLACEPVKGGRPGLPAWLGKLPPPLPKKR